MHPVHTSMFLYVCTIYVYVYMYLCTNVCGNKSTTWCHCHVIWSNVMEWNVRRLCAPWVSGFPVTHHGCRACMVMAGWSSRPLAKCQLWRQQRWEGFHDLPPCQALATWVDAASSGHDLSSQQSPQPVGPPNWNRPVEVGGFDVSDFIIPMTCQILSIERCRGMLTQVSWLHQWTILVNRH